MVWAGLTREPEAKEQSESIFPAQRSQNGSTGSFKRTKEKILPGASAHTMRTSLVPVFSLVFAVEDHRLSTESGGYCDE